MAFELDAAQMADPFLWIDEESDVWTLFFETKSNRDMQGDIGVAESRDGGASWRYLGIALDEAWHLSYPHVFSWEGQMYMVPEGYQSGALRVYIAEEFPLKWRFLAKLHPQPLIDASIVEFEGRWWLFATDASASGSSRCRMLSLWHASSPLGPWLAHAASPVMSGDAAAGARSGGRVVAVDGKLVRFGQDCAGGYGQGLVAYRVDVLTPTEFRQTRVPLEFGAAGKHGMRAWNGARHHHLDAHQVCWWAGCSVPGWEWVGSQGSRAEHMDVSRTAVRVTANASHWSTWKEHSAGKHIPSAASPPAQLRDGSWVAVMDGDWQASGALSWRMKRDALLLLALWAGAAASALGGRRVAALVPALPCAGGPRERRRKLPRARAPGACAGGGASRRASALLRRLGPRARIALAAGVAAGLATAAALGALGWYYGTTLHARVGAARAPRVGGQASAYTVMLLSHGPRVPTLKVTVGWVSQCPSVAEVVIIWNSGKTPDTSGWAAPGGAPVRLRLSPRNELTNRFLPDPLLRTRAVLTLDDDILSTCADVEALFAAWRRDPGLLAGMFPRLAGAGPPAAYAGEQEVYRRGRYNMVLTGGMVLDADRIFPLFNSPQYAEERAYVNSVTNCEDLLVNFVVAEVNAARGNVSASMLRPRRRLDISKLMGQGVGISRDRGSHQAKREACVERFAQRLVMPVEQEVPVWVDRPPCLSWLGCVYL
ncbi:Exostosin-2 [Auxenochlorella protothecoides]|uniref:Exostosin-2 n=1 Tax=Auxenochlorella protothecoides TaxID=3075 RepID=A0A087SGU0_AUXPR|nr:Exostosin-2 [Auxenochlorella protothecoides]KFM24944.1 Exostosin-2 [Auxenochlorella protothecoides]